jgi:hypothetical protein
MLCDSDRAAPSLHAHGRGSTPIRETADDETALGPTLVSICRVGDMHEDVVAQLGRVDG